MANRTVTVKPSDGDYTSLNTALATEMAAYPNLTTNNGSGGAGILTFECYNLGAGDVAATTGTAWTTSSSYYIRIIGAASELTSGNKGKWSTDRYRIEATGADYNGLYIRAANTRVEDLQVQLTVTGAAGGDMYAYNVSASGVYVLRCIGKGVISGNNTTRQISGLGIGASGTSYCYNSLFYDFHNGGRTEAHCGIRLSYSGHTINADNCTTENCYYGFYRSSGTFNATNCGAAVPADGTGFSGTITQTTCSATTPTFVNQAGDDFHLAGEDAAWRDGGTDLSGTFTDDIDGQTRVGTWDIGADEYLSTIPAGSIFVEIRL